MMNKKGSLSLSINAIVVLILAIVMLGLALGFIKTMFGKVSGQVEALVSNEPEPDVAGPSNPVTLSRSVIVVGPSQTTAIKFSVYNPIGDFASNPILDTDDTTISNNCLVASGGTTSAPSPFEVKSAINKAVLSGSSVTSQAVLKAHNAAGETLCKICVVANLGGGCADVRVIIK